MRPEHWTHKVSRCPQSRNRNKTKAVVARATSRSSRGTVGLKDELKFQKSECSSLRWQKLIQFCELCVVWTSRVFILYLDWRGD